LKDSKIAAVNMFYLPASIKGYRLYSWQHLIHHLFCLNCCFFQQIMSD